MKTFTNLIEDYKKSIYLITDNKWLYGTILFFVLCSAITNIPTIITQKILLNQTFGNGPLLNPAFFHTQQSFSEKLLYAVYSVHPLSVLSSISFSTIFGLLGVVVAFLVFYKKIRLLRSMTIIKKIALYSALFFIFGIVVSLLAFLILKNTVLIFLGIIISMISFWVISILLFTIVEALFISLLIRLLSKEVSSFESISEHSSKFIKRLFLFNLVLYFVTTNFFTQISLIQNYLSLLMQISFNGILSVVLSNMVFYISWFAYYFHPLFVILFIFTPFVLSINSDTKLFPALKENLSKIKSDIGYYVPLVILTLLILCILVILLNFIDPSVLFSSQPLIILLSNAIYSLLFTSVLVIFYVTAFKKILSTQK